MWIGLQAGYGKSIRKHQLGVSVPGHRQDGFRQSVDELDKVVHFHSFFLGSHQRLPSWFLSKLKGLEIG